MRRTVVLAVMSLAVLLVVGWRWWSVPLATGPAPDPNYCRYLSSEEGELVEGLLGLEVKTRDRTHTMTWPVGFTARRSAEGIEVLSASGTVVAATGHTY